MEWSALESRWNEYKNHAKLRWSRIPDDKINETLGRRDSLSLMVQQTYAVTPEEADRQIAAWLARQSDKTAHKA